MPANQRNSTVRGLATRVILAITLLFCTAGGSCDLVDVLGFIGYNGGSINLVIPLGLGGGTGVLSGGGTTTTPTDGTTDGTIATTTSAAITPTSTTETAITMGDEIITNEVKPPSSF